MRRAWLCLFLACEACSPSDPLRVVSLNIRWNAPSDGPNGWAFRRESLLRAVDEFDAELLALQEVTGEQWAEVQTGLPRYKLSRVGKGDVVVGLKDYDQLVRTATVNLPGDYTRSILLAELELRGRRMTFAGLHLGGAPELLEMAATKVIDQFADFPRPWVLAGDFNTLPYRFAEWPMVEGEPVIWDARTRCYQMFMEAGFVDGYRRLHPGSTRSSASGFDPEWRKWEALGIDARIDWVLATPELSFTHAEIIEALTPEGRPISDHWPVIAHLD